MHSRIQFDPLQIAKQFADFSQRLLQGSEMLRSVKDRDVQIATTPKTEVFRQDKTTLYHYEPMAKRAVAVPWSSMDWSGATRWPICRKIAH